MSFPGGGETPSGDELVAFSIVAEHAPFDPREGTTLALVYDVEDDWHIYWRNNGDSGMPPSWEFELPAGVTLGEPEWPAPHRYTTGGVVLDYVLEGKVVVLVPLEIADHMVESMVDAGTGELTIRATSEWLVCKDICLAGGGEDEIVLPFAATEGSATNEALFEAAREALPVETDDVADGALGAGVEASFVDGELRLEAPGAAKLEWFGWEHGKSPRVADALNGAVAEGERLRVVYGPDAADAEVIGGVLRVYADADDDESVAVRIAVDGPAAGR